MNEEEMKEHMDGFRYNGKHSEDFHCYFIPNESDRWFASPNFDVYENSDAGRDGGYYYGSRAKVRSFELRCYYEDITIAQREAIRRWLDRGTFGKLFFDDRPFVAYDVRPTKVVSGKRYAVYNSETGEELYSGTFTITFSAYFPYGYLNCKDYTSLDEEGIGQYCGIIKHSMMPTAPTTSSRAFQLYNCGTQTCSTVLRVGGTAATGLTITNTTNQTSCTLSSLPSTGYLEIDSRYGSIKWIHGTDSDYAFNYHVNGFITLEPYIACEDEIVVSYTSGSSSITMTSNKFDDRFIGKYIYIEGAWRRITGVSAGGAATVNFTPSNTGVQETKVVTMNDIVITGTDLALTTLEVDYFPIIV